MNEECLMRSCFVQARWTASLRCPLVAILRGVQPSEVVQVGKALAENGLKLGLKRTTFEIMVLCCGLMALIVV